MSNVLEVGCRTGSTALLLAGHVKHITAIDISSNMIDIARNKAKDQQIENVDFIHSTLFDDTLKKGSFDVIMAFSFLHLLEETPEAIRRIKKLLKPGGIFISKTPCLADQSKLLRVFMGGSFTSCKNWGSPPIMSNFLALMSLKN